MKGFLGFLKEDKKLTALCGVIAVIIFLSSFVWKILVYISMSFENKSIAESQITACRFGIYFILCLLVFVIIVIILRHMNRKYNMGGKDFVLYSVAYLFMAVAVFVMVLIILAVLLSIGRTGAHNYVLEYGAYTFVLITVILIFPAIISMCFNLVFKNQKITEFIDGSFKYFYMKMVIYVVFFILVTTFITYIIKGSFLQPLWLNLVFELFCIPVRTIVIAYPFYAILKEWGYLK